MVRWLSSVPSCEFVTLKILQVKRFEMFWHDFGSIFNLTSMSISFVILQLYDISLKRMGPPPLLINLLWDNATVEQRNPNLQTHPPQHDFTYYLWTHNILYVFHWHSWTYILILNHQMGNKIPIHKYMLKMPFCCLPKVDSTVCCKWFLTTQA